MSNDAFVECGCGRRHWGLAGAAGLLVRDEGRVLLQLRAEWTHGGGTWALPGGAIAPGEDAVAAALREAAEEAGILPEQVTLTHQSVCAHPDWSYTTIVARAGAGLAPFTANDESTRLEWVDPDDVDGLALHPAFAESWPLLRPLLADPVVVVDGANVVGSRPDGWWKDRAGAAARLVARLQEAEWRPGADFGIPADLVRPEFHVILEGQAKAGVPAGGQGSVVVHHASGEGDDAIVALAARLADEGRPAVVVTSDRGLRERLAGTATWVGARALV